VVIEGVYALEELELFAKVPGETAGA